MQAVLEHVERPKKKKKCFEIQLTFKSFWECAAKKFNIPTLDLKVFDDSKTEVDEQVFDLLLKTQTLVCWKFVWPKIQIQKISRVVLQRAAIPVQVEILKWIQMTQYYYNTVLQQDEELKTPLWPKWLLSLVRMHHPLKVM
ncbi:uncharacterized protein LOC111947393 isoform X2 [Oryzias latipes]